jgi:hypothetical protein
LVADCRIGDLPLTLSNPRHFAAVEEDARQVGADVIIVDTVTEAFDLDNENDNAECTRVMKRLIQLAQRLNAVVIFLHHVGKAKQEEGQTAQSVHRARGGSAFSGNSTAILNLLADPKSDEIVTLECAKVKGEKFEDCLLKLDKQSRWFTSAGAVEKTQSPYDQVIGIFNGQPLKTKEIKEKLANLKLSERAIEKALEDAVKLKDLLSPRRGVYQKPDQNPDSAQRDYRPLGASAARRSARTSQARAVGAHK